MKNIEETIKLLNYIQENPRSTQRELGNELHVSLGKVNFLITALTRKGIIKLKRFKNSRNKSAYLYLITPEGIRRKAEITKRFLKRKIEEYDELKHEIDRLKREVQDNVIGDE